MSTALFMRAASVISVLFAAGHTLGGRRSWSFAGETEVLSAMRSFRFEAFGVSRTYMDFYLGFGFTLSVYLVLQAVLLWQLATVAGSGAVQIRPILLSFIVASIASGILTWRFIFPMPVFFGAAITACLIAAFVVAR